MGASAFLFGDSFGKAKSLAAHPFAPLHCLAGVDGLWVGWPLEGWADGGPGNSVGTTQNFVLDNVAPLLAPEVPRVRPALLGLCAIFPLLGADLAGRLLGRELPALPALPGRDTLTQSQGGDSQRGEPHHIGGGSERPRLNASADGTAIAIGIFAMPESLGVDGRRRWQWRAPQENNLKDRRHGDV